mgnify:CR=1 FL=1
MFIVIKSEHYDCTNLICKKDTLEEAVAAVKDSMAQRINKNYHAGLTGMISRTKTRPLRLFFHLR